MHLRRGLRPALFTTAAAAAAGFAFVTPALAAPDPAGNNGTVKIDEVRVNENGVGEVVDDGHANNPHVPCDFAVSFYGFDKGQTAKITFTIHPPSSKDRQVLLSETKTISDDEAAGGNDEDAVFTYSGKDFGLDRFKRHEKQGYHVKLTIESEGLKGGNVKHKVFWLDCQTAQADVTPAAPKTEEVAAAATPTTSPVSEEDTLPITGTAIGAIVVLGLALAGGGTALVLYRRRRDKVTFVS